MMIAIASSSIASAQEKKDSLVVENPRRVVIVSDETSQSVSIQGSEDDPDYTYYRKVETGKSGNVYENERVGLFDFNLPFTEKPKTEKAKFNAGFFNLFAGHMVYPAVEEPYRFQNFRSGEWGFTLFRYRSRPIGKHMHFTSGLGFGFKDFRSTDDIMYHKVDGGITVVPVPDGMKLKRSVVSVASVTVPFMLDFYSSNDKFGFMFGPIVYVNLPGSITNVYKVNGDRRRELENNVHVRPITLEYMALIRYSDLGLFVKWAPHGIFNPKYSVDLKMVTVGTILNFNW